jgi:hypothetical protein
MEKVVIFYGQSEYIMDIWNTLWRYDVLVCQKNLATLNWLCGLASLFFID